MKLPLDPTPEEVEIYDVMMRRTHINMGTEHLYEMIPDPADKFLVAYVFELGHTRRSAEQALGLSKATIWKRIKGVKDILARYGVSNRLLNAIDNMEV